MTDEANFCLECGRPMTSLKRHLRAAHGRSPEECRMRWDLTADYRMISPNYMQRQSDIAKQIGLEKTGASPKIKPPRVQVGF